MLTGRIPGLAQDLSRIVLGTMIITTDEQEKSFALLDAAVASGVTTIDTAYVYAGGKSERCIGLWMEERKNRDRIVILTKGCHHNQDRNRVTPYDIGADLHDSLARLRTGYIDIYLLHRDDPTVPVGPIVECLNHYYREGKIKAFGGSNWSHQRIREANEYAASHGLIPFAASSPNFGLAEQVDNPWGEGCVTISGPSNKEARAWYQQSKVGVFAYSSLARGLFSGRVTRENAAETADGACQRAYCHEVNFRRLDRLRTLAAEKKVSVPQLALAWVLRQDFNVYALVGAGTPDEVRENLVACDLALTPDEIAWLDLRKER